MTNFKATIYEQDGTTELLEDIVVRIQETDDGIPSWHGSFETDDDDFLNMAGKVCTLKLDDGRSGDIVIKAPSHISPPRIPFQGSGPLS